MSRGWRVSATPPRQSTDADLSRGSITEFPNWVPDTDVHEVRSRSSLPGFLTGRARRSFTGFVVAVQSQRSRRARRSHSPRLTRRESSAGHAVNAGTRTRVQELGEGTPSTHDQRSRGSITEFPNWVPDTDVHDVRSRSSLPGSSPGSARGFHHGVRGRGSITAFKTCDGVHIRRG